METELPHIFELLRERQGELKARFDALEMAAESDGGPVPERELDLINDELRFLARLAKTRMRELESMRS